MRRWVRSYWPEGDATYVREVGEDGCVTRSIELSGAAGRPRAAAALAEVVKARDTGGVPAVQAYEARYGVAPEKPIEDWNFPHGDITEAEFDGMWEAARRVIEAD